MKIPILGPSYTPWQSTSTDAPTIVIESERSVNLYPEVIESGEGREKLSLLATPGISNFADLGTSAAVWELFYEQKTDRLFAISGTKGGTLTLFEISTGGSVTNRGNLSTGNGTQINIVSNGVQVFIVMWGYAWVFTLATNVLTDVTVTVGTALGTAVVSGTYMDGYFVACSPGAVGVSSLNDATTWNALDIVAPSVVSDLVNGLAVAHGILWVFCNHHIELYYDTANPTGFPFSLVVGQSLDVGGLPCPTALSGPSFISQFPGGNLVWIGLSPAGAYVVYMSQGQQAVRISNHAIEGMLKASIVNSAGQGSGGRDGQFVYEESGHTFFVINLTTPNISIAYDAVNGMWSERMYLNGNTEERLRQRCHVPFALQHYVGDRSNGKVYLQSFANQTDTGTAIKRIRRLPHFVSEMHFLRYSALLVDSNPGQATHQRVELNWSNDGGQTYKFSGTVNTSGTAVTLVTGVGWNSGWVGGTIRIGTTYYTISAVADSSHLTLSSTAGSQSGVPYMGLNIVDIGIIHAGSAVEADFKKRAFFPRCGQARDRVFEITMVDTAPWVIVGGYAEVEQGTS